MPITTTLATIRAAGPCREGWEKLLKGLGKTTADEEPFAFSKILDTNGLADTMWCMRAHPQHDKVWREFALWCARQVSHLATDPRVSETLSVVQRYLDGNATEEELRAASRAASEDASWAASWAASAASRAASEDASWAASWAASAACAACAARSAQVEKLRELLDR